jgi:hypothetical protein
VPNVDVERNARIPYQSGGECLGSPYCVASLTTVPAGYRLVAERISILITNPTGAAPVGYLTDTAERVLETLAGGSVAFGIAGLNQPVTAYFDAGDSPQIDMPTASHLSL